VHTAIRSITSVNSGRPKTTFQIVFPASEKPEPYIQINWPDGAKKYSLRVAIEGLVKIGVMKEIEE